MKKRSITPKNKPEHVKRERDPIPWRYGLLSLVCGLILVGGFFWAARQHFSAMDFGIKNAKLRQLRENLEAEQRRLYLSKEISLAPAEIKKVAKKIGLQDLTARSIEMINGPKNSEPDAAKKTTGDNQKNTSLNKSQNARTDKEDKNKDAEEKNAVNKKSTTEPKLPQGSVTRPRIAKK